MCILSWLSCVTSAFYYLERLVSKATYYVLSNNTNNKALISLAL